MDAEGKYPQRLFFANLLEPSARKEAVIKYLSSTYKVSYKENPLKAIAWLQEGNLPDLIISDLNMPEMSGEEFLVYP